MGEIQESVKIACCQLELEIGNIQANLAGAEAAIREASEFGARMVVLPELSNTGYMFENTAEGSRLAVKALAPTLLGWQRLSSDLGIVLVGGIAEVGDDEVLYNSAVLFDNGDLKATYRKAHLWDREKEIFSAGNHNAPVVETSLGRIGVMICYDLEFPEWVRSVALRGADLLAAPVNWPLFPRPDGERPSEIVRVQANASVNRMAIVACDRMGEERGQGWLGGSVIVDADGYPQSNIALGSTGNNYADLDLRVSRDKSISARNNVHFDRRPELYVDGTVP